MRLPGTFIPLFNQQFDKVDVNGGGKGLVNYLMRFIVAPQRFFTALSFINKFNENK